MAVTRATALRWFFAGVLLIGLTLCALNVWAAPSVLNATSHAAADIAPAINAVLGSGHVDNPIFVDDNPTGTAFSLPGDSSNGTLVFRSVTTNLPVNHATYETLNASLCCYTPTADQMNYALLAPQGTLFAQPVAIQVGGALPIGTAPPTIMSTGSSPNSGDGGSGWGVEFGLSVSYLGLDTSEDSFVSAELAGFLVALQFNHPAWTAFDVKGALRQTASQWTTGYSATQFGFGLISWSAANALTPSAIFLQGPGMRLSNRGSYAVITLYPFKTTRRSVEAIYSVNAAYVWPVKSEYTATDIAASAATLLYTSNGTDVTPIFTYVPAASGSVTLVAFTLDGLGGYSRVEPFTFQTASFIVGTSCLH